MLNSHEEAEIVKQSIEVDPEVVIFLNFIKIFQMK